jgi:hypothetical protein
MYGILALLLQTEDPGAQVGGAAAAGIGIVMGLVWLAVAVLLIASMWKVFVKAGEPGWAAIVPIYNLVILLKIIGKPAWWVILMLIPFVNFVIAIILSLGLAQAFGKSAGFGIGLLLLPFIFYPILGFGSARYQGVPAGAPAMA